MLGGGRGGERGRGAKAVCFPIPLVTVVRHGRGPRKPPVEMFGAGLNLEQGIRITSELVKAQSTGSGGEGGRCWQVLSHRLSEKNKATKFVMFANFCDRNTCTTPPCPWLILYTDRTQRQEINKDIDGLKEHHQLT